MQTGERLGDYALRREIGEGGIAAVFFAEDARGADVVMKVLRPEFVAQPAMVSLFLGEPRALQAVEHENTVEVTDVVADAPRPYFVTELLRGRTLSELLKGGPIPLARALRIVRQVAVVLAHAHDVDVVHRNLKPSNVFLVRKAGRADFVKLLELGATRMQSHEGKPVPGTVIGTPAYMAPEQLRQTAGDHRVDMYSFGVLLFELVVGRKPFVGDLAETVRQHLLVTAPRARSMAPDLPQALDDLIAQCLEKDPAARPPSMHEVSLALGVLADNAGPAKVGDEGPGASVAVPKNTSGFTTVAADVTVAPAAVFDDEEPSFPSVTDEIPAVRDTVEDKPVVSVPPAAVAPSRPAPPMAPIGRQRAGVAGLRWPVVAAALVATAAVAGGIGAAVAWRAASPSTVPPAAGQATDGHPTQAPSTAAPPTTAPPTTAPPTTTPPTTAPPTTAPPTTAPDAPGAADAAGGSPSEPLVAFDSVPRHAQVWIRMDHRIRLLCKTPCSFALPAGKKILVELRLDGYRSAQRTLTVAEGAHFRGTLRPR